MDDLHELQWLLKNSKKELVMWERDTNSVYKEEKIQSLKIKINELEDKIFEKEYEILIANEEGANIEG